MLGPGRSGSARVRESEYGIDEVHFEEPASIESES